jgi:hypothetical protein
VTDLRARVRDALLRWGNASLGPPGLSGILFVALFGVILWAPLLSGDFSVLRDSDTCWLIQTGLWIRAHGAVPAHNPLGGSYPVLSAVPLVCYQWLFELILGLAYQWLNLQGVVLWVAFLFAWSYVLLVFWLYRRGFKGIPGIMGAILISLMVLTLFAIARPMLMSLFLTAVLLWLLFKPLSEKAKWVVFPLLFLLWANAHLGFIAGLLIFGCFQAEAAWRLRSGRPIGLWLLCAVATLVNPAGAGLYTYFWGLAHSPFMMDNIRELKPPPWERPIFVLYFVLVALSGVFAWQDARIRPAERVLFLLSLVLGVYSFRHVYLLGLISLPFLAASLERCSGMPPCFASRCFVTYFVNIGRHFKQEREKPMAWILALLLVGALCAKGHRFPAAFPQTNTLAGVMGYLNRNLPTTPILTSEQWGSYLIFFSDARGYLDSRMDMYGDTAVKDFTTAYHLSEGWRSVFKRMKIRYALYPSTSLGSRYLARVQGWRILYQDKTATLLMAPPGWQP